MSTKQPKTATVTVNGKQYKLQHPGVRWYMRNTDECRNNAGVLMVEKYAQNLLDHVVIEPAGLTIDDFDSVGELEELIQQIERFCRS